MPVYTLTYDLICKDGETRDYQPIWDAIDGFPNFQVLYSVFLVEAASAVTVENAIKPTLRKNDRYFIDRLRPSEYRYSAMKGVNQWLAAHPPG